MGTFGTVSVHIKVSIGTVALVTIKGVDAVSVVTTVVLVEHALVLLLLAVAVGINVPTAFEFALAIIAFFTGFAVWLVVRVAKVVWGAVVAGVTVFASALVSLAFSVALGISSTGVSSARISIAFLDTLAVGILDVAIVADTLVLGASIVLAG